MEVPLSNQSPQVLEPSGPGPQKKKKSWIFVGFVIIVALGMLTIIFFLRNKPEKAIITQLLPTTIPPTIVPTPLPFSEMTIPYLRQQKFVSSLGSLEEAYSSLNYRAYLTSYTSDGLKINALLTKPTGEKPSAGWPAIVLVHGYIPPAQYQTNGSAYATYVDYLARNGFVVFKIDLRGHGNSEGNPGGAYYSSDYIIDTLNAYAALQEADFVNKNKIGLWGHSMAGNVVMRSWAALPAIPAVVIWAGAVYTYEDMQKYRINDQSYQPPLSSNDRQKRRRELFEKHGSPSAQVVFWQQVAPVSYLNDLKGAIQIHHAIDDDVVNIGYSRDLQALLDRTSVRHELFEYSSGGHNISGASFTQAMQRTVEFFKKNLEF